MKSLRLLGAATVVLVGPTLALANHQYTLTKVSKPPACEGALYDRNALFPRDDTFPTVHLPAPANSGGPADPGMIAAKSRMIVTGAAAGPSATPALGALPSSGGTAMATARQRADRELQRLIRQLD